MEWLRRAPDPLEAAAEEPERTFKAPTGPVSAREREARRAERRARRRRRELESSWRYKLVRNTPLRGLGGDRALQMGYNLSAALVCIYLVYAGVQVVLSKPQGPLAMQAGTASFILVELVFLAFPRVQPLLGRGELAAPHGLVDGIVFAALAGAVFALFSKSGALAGRAPGTATTDVARMVDRILTEAVNSRASDVHIESTPEAVVLRYRVDGVLHKVAEYPAKLRERIIARIKVMAQMDIAEKREPQDGATTINADGTEVDLRISSVPGSHGERVVIRVLDRRAGLYGLESLGLEGTMLQKLQRIIANPHGVFFCTGPTGSGKTTTLYAAIMQVDRAGRNVITVEDPVEYQLSGITQLPVGKRKGMTFADGLRSILRQDPDVIMVGEVRDQETAHMVIEAAQTGHLVLSTLHTNDSAGAVARLLDLKVEPFLLASSLTAVLAQRLVRRVCPHCSEPYEPSEPELKELGLAPAGDYDFRRATGCARCLDTGYRGRTGLYELLVIDEGLRDLVTQRADAAHIQKLAIEHGMVPLRADGAAKAARGITTVEEVRRVTQGAVVV
jgi:type II secretory ATPase GspE/PulE/Tfp pilus assembly ATPase PilB-like protein